MNRFLRKTVLMAVIVAPLVAGQRGCSDDTTTNPATLSCMQKYINQGVVNQTTYEYYKQICAAQAP